MAEGDQTGYPLIDPAPWPPPPALLMNGDVDEHAVREWTARWVFANGGTEWARRQGARRDVQ